MKFIDLLTKEKQRKANKYRPPNCSEPDECSPSDNIINEASGTGVCAGLLHKEEDLDCIQLCLFSIATRKGKSGKTKIRKLEKAGLIIAPHEALSLALVLLSATKDALELSSDYQRHLGFLLDRHLKKGG